MHEAIDVLVRSGWSDLASDLNRIRQVVDFDDIEVFRCPRLDRLADEILETTTLAQFAGCLGQLAEAIGLDHCTLHVINEAPITNFSAKVLTTYSDAWISRYVDRRYAYTDPVSRECVTADRCFFWDSLPRVAPAVRAFWEDAASHGVGSSGYTLPLVTERGDKLAISVCSRLDAEAFRDHFEHFESDLFIIGVFLADAFCRLASDSRPASFNPTDDQLTILRAIAMGASESELRDLDYQYGSFKTLERSICALFRTRTVAQAAVLAARIGLMADAPLTRADILRASVNGPTTANTATSVPLRRLVRLQNLAAADAVALTSVAERGD